MLYEMARSVCLIDVDSKIPNLARWCNNKVIFAAAPRFEDYENQRKATRK